MVKHKTGIHTPGQEWNERWNAKEDWMTEEILMEERREQTGKDEQKYEAIKNI